MTTRRVRPGVRAALTALPLLWLALPMAASAQNPCNPCAGRNPCAAANPCAANPCNPCAGGASVDASRFEMPAGAEVETSAALAARGEALWNDPSLSTNGLACATCHTGRYGQMRASFLEPYPHRVDMPADQAGVAEVHAAEMVNFCMIRPMAAEPLAWDSTELAALTSYVEKIQPGYAAWLEKRNPCAAAGANPCNPCAAANPCNPCGTANPCNPCAGR